MALTMVMIESRDNPDFRHPLTMFQSDHDTPVACQFQTFAPLPRSPSPCMRYAGNSSLSLAGSDRNIDESVLANFLPSGDTTLQTGLLQTYSHPTMKKGFSRSYTLIGPERMRPPLVSAAEQTGQ